MDGENCNYEKGGIVDKWLTGDEECDAYSTEFECGGVYNKNHMDILGNRDQIIIHKTPTKLYIVKKYPLEVKIGEKDRVKHNI